MAITTGLVPIYIEERNKDKAEASRMMSALSTFLFVISVVFIALCMLFAPWLLMCLLLALRVLNWT